MCETCKYRDNLLDNNYKNNPCNTCIYWSDSGYREFRNYVFSNVTLVNIGNKNKKKRG